MWIAVAVMDGLNKGTALGPAIAVAVVCILVALAMFWAAVGHYAVIWRIRSLAFCAVLTIFLFAQVYHLNGIVVEEIDMPPESVSFWNEAVYYSIVTWATLGYGDISPTEEMRLIAAVEAVLGYLYMGLLIAVLIQLGQEGSGGQGRAAEAEAVATRATAAALEAEAVAVAARATAAAAAEAEAVAALATAEAAAKAETEALAAQANAAAAEAEAVATRATAAAAAEAEAVATRATAAAAEAVAARATAAAVADDQGGATDGHRVDAGGKGRNPAKGR